MKVLFIIVLIVVLGVVIFIFADRKEVGDLTAPQITPTATPTPVQGAMEKVRKQGELKDVSGGQGSGMAQTLFENGKFTHSVITLIPDPPSGKFYEGWLVKKEGGKVVNFFSTGKMTKEGGAYILKFEDTKDYPEHNFVVITLEEVDDKKPEKHILDGDLSVVNQ
ncbi:MAG: anti-sigma factor [Patescibacteria group bacterium]